MTNTTTTTTREYSSPLTAEQLDLVEAAAQRAIEGMLVKLGVDTKDPFSAQKDFAKLRSMRALMDDPEFQADLAFMRKWRVNTEVAVNTSWQSIVRWVTVGFLGLLLLGTKEWWLKHITG